LIRLLRPAAGASRQTRLAFLVALLLVPGARAEEPAEPPSNRLRWSTASEIDNFGYDVYRAESEEGPFERITEDPVLGAGTTDLPSSYEYLDENIEPEQTYYYFVESISMSGVRERFTPVIRAEPGSRRGADEPGPGAQPGPAPDQQGR